VEFIAEIGLNHNGDLTLAKEMVSAAKEAGATMVKFQSLKADNLFTAKSLSNHFNIAGFPEKKTLGDFFNMVSLSVDSHKEIKEYCDKTGIEFLSTPLDLDNVDVLDKIGVSRFKIASGDITHFPLVEYVAGTIKPLILSTGASTMEEIREAIEILKANSVKDITLLHCVSLYPAPPELANLGAITRLKAEFNLPVGFSDHTMGFHIALAAIAKGASIIEKHFTINRKLPGPDQKLSSTPDEFKKMVQYGTDIFHACKTDNKNLSSRESGLRESMRRGIVAARDLRKDCILTLQDMAFKRPREGISAGEYKKVLGKKLLKDKKRDEGFQFSDFI
jgi:N,N'-diacetyllegionaminate synthase